jgi:hypothetical protein
MSRRGSTAHPSLFQLASKFQSNSPVARPLLNLRPPNLLAYNNRNNPRRSNSTNASKPPSRNNNNKKSTTLAFGNTKRSSNFRQAKKNLGLNAYNVINVALLTNAELFKIYSDVNASYGKYGGYSSALRSSNQMKIESEKLKRSNDRRKSFNKKRRLPA